MPESSSQLDRAGVGHLAAACRIERRLAQLREEEVVLELLVRADLREDVGLRVPDELRREVGRSCEVRRPLRLAGAPRTRDLAVTLHLDAIPVDVDRLAALSGELDRELDGEPVRRGERECLLAGDRLAGLELLEQLEPALERLSEALLLESNDARDLVALRREIRIRLAHLLDDDGGETMHVGEPDALRLLHRAADDAPKDVAAPLVRRRDAVADEERHPATVIGEDPVRLRRRRRVAVRDAGLRGDPVHDLPVAVRLVHGPDVLEDRRAALEAEAGVDVLRRQRGQRAVGVLLVRHEHEVPELEEPMTARTRGRAVGLAAAVLLAPVPVDLGVGPARSGATHRPEVLRCREWDDPLARHPDPLPQLDRLLVRAELHLRVAGMNRHPHALPVELHVLLDELARELDRAFLVVLPEREVPEHLEERQVMAVEPHLVDVDRPEALLRQGRQRCGRRLVAEEERHLRVHAGGGEERRVVPARGTSEYDGQRRWPRSSKNERIALTQLGGRAHPGILRARSRASGARR